MRQTRRLTAGDLFRACGQQLVVGGDEGGLEAVRRHGRMVLEVALRGAGRFVGPGKEGFRFTRAGCRGIPIRPRRWAGMMPEGRMSGALALHLLSGLVSCRDTGRTLRTNQVMTSAGGSMGAVVPWGCMCVPAPLEMASSETSQEQLLGGLPGSGWAQVSGGNPPHRDERRR